MLINGLSAKESMLGLYKNALTIGRNGKMYILHLACALASIF